MMSLVSDAPTKKINTFILRSDSGKRVLYWNSKSIRKIYSCILVGKKQTNKHKHRHTYTTPCDFGTGCASLLEPAIKQRGSKHWTWTLCPIKSSTCGRCELRGVNPTRIEWCWHWWASPCVYNPLTTRSILVPFRCLPLVWENNRCHVTLGHIVALPPQKNLESPVTPIAPPYLLSTCPRWEGCPKHQVWSPP